jgi:hypothetical protein
MSFVIMLDKELAAHQNDWPITAEEGTLIGIRGITQHSGNPLLVPSSSRTMQRIESKSLTDTQTGSIDTGGIFESTNTN